MAPRTTVFATDWSYGTAVRTCTISAAIVADLAEIDRLEPRLKRLDDNTLRQSSERLGSQIRGGSSPDEGIVEEAAALVREAAWRILGQRPFEVQILAGLAMHEGRLVEMATGEGKTLTAVLPAYLGGLTGRGVHVLTFNDYLARRDAQWMGPIYRFLGLSVGWVGRGHGRSGATGSVWL